MFGDKTIQPDPFTYATLQGDGFQLDAGSAHGVTEGSKFDIYPPGAKRFDDPSQAVARVLLTSVGPFTSQAQILERVAPAELDPAEPPKKYRAAERIHVYTSPPIPVVLTPTTSALERVHKLLAESEAFKGHFRLIDDGPAKLVIEQTKGADPNKQLIQLTRGGDNKAFFSVAADDARMLQQVEDHVRNWSRWYRVRELANPSSNLQVEFIMQPSPGEATPEGRPGMLDFRLREGQKFDMLVKNNSDKKLFLYLLDITGDGRVKDLLQGRTLPLNPETPKSFEGNTASIPKTADGPSFREMVKVILSEKEIPLQSLIVAGEKGRGSASRSPLSDLLSNAGLVQGTSTWAKTQIPENGPRFLANWK